VRYIDEIKRATEIMKEWNVKCNCGGPQYGTDHAPDCAINLAWDDAIEQARDEQYELEIAQDPE